MKLLAPFFFFFFPYMDTGLGKHHALSNSLFSVWLAKEKEAMAQRKTCQENVMPLAVFLPKEGFMSLNGDRMEEKNRW